MPTGVVKFFNEGKGFGFITVDGAGNDLFVHVSGLAQPVREGDKVSFDVTEGKKGPNAINVKKLA